MSATSEPKQCPKCGGPIPAEAPQGLCPKCLLEQASIPTEAGKGESARQIPPSLKDVTAAFPGLEILELIGQGGMGFVFKARQPRLERFVALKILPQSFASDPAFANRFAREGRLLARLNHPNIVTIHDFGQANGFFYLLMEFVDGVNLRQAMRAGRFTPEQALAVVPKICDALQFAHNEGVLHRDIKPENILLDSKGRLKIADFGIAKLVGEPQVDAKLTGSSGTLGTPHYMAPEQIENPAAVDHRADIYSLGVVFYEMLTGELPLGKFQPPSRKVQVDVRLDDVVLHALEKEPARRYQQASEVKTAVDTITSIPPRPRGHPLPGEREAVRASPASTQKPDRFWRRFAITAAAVVLAMILIPVAAILLGILLPAIQKTKSARQEAKAAENAASAEKELQTRPKAWSPDLELSASETDLFKIRDAAKSLMEAGEYAPALERYLWYYQHGASKSQNRLLSILPDWIELGRRYPPAKQALMDIRNRSTAELEAGKGYGVLFQEVASINAEVGKTDATYALFKDLREKDPKLAQQCYFFAESLLVSKGDYEWCAQYMGDPNWRFDLIRQGFDMERANQERMAQVRSNTAQQIAATNLKRGVTNTWRPPDTSEMIKKSSYDRFVGQSRQLIEILVGTGRRAEAEKIRDRALTIMDDSRLKSAISDAEEKVRKFRASSAHSIGENGPTISSGKDLEQK